jgi:hypothetical protein
MSVRALMVLVLVVGGLLGWTINRARRQQRTVAWIVKSGGSVTYDDRNWYRDFDLEFRGSYPYPDKVSWAPEWLVDRIGIDYFHRVVRVVFQPQSDEHAAAAVNALKEIGPPRDLTLHGPLFVDRFVRRLDELNGIEGLRLVSLPFRLTDKAWLASLARLRQLRFLAIVGSEFGDDGLKAITALKQLECLELSYARITDSGLAHLESLPRLKTLVLGPSHLSPAGLRRLHGLSRLDSLTIGDSRLVESGLKELKSLRRLKRLGLEGTPISDAGLGDVTELTSLEQLNVFDTNVSYEGRKKLRVALPRTAVEPVDDSVLRSNK